MQIFPKSVTGFPQRPTVHVICADFHEQPDVVGSANVSNAPPVLL